MPANSAAVGRFWAHNIAATAGCKSQSEVSILLRNKVGTHPFKKTVSPISPASGWSQQTRTHGQTKSASGSPILVASFAVAASEDKKKTAYTLFLDCSGQFRLDVPLACLEVLHACQFLLSPCSQACRRAKPSRTLQQPGDSTMQKMRGCVTSSRVKASPTVSPRWTSRTSNGTSSLSFRSWSLGGTSCGCSEAARIQTGGSVAPSLQHEKDDAVWPLPETGRHR